VLHSKSREGEKVNAGGGEKEVCEDSKGIKGFGLAAVLKRELGECHRSVEREQGCREEGRRLERALLTIDAEIEGPGSTRMRRKKTAKRIGRTRQRAN